MMCLNRRVLIGVAIVGLTLWLVAPGNALRALPLLACLACPLSMLLMFRGGSSDSSATDAADRNTTPQRDVFGDVVGRR